MNFPKEVTNFLNFFKNKIINEESIEWRKLLDFIFLEYILKDKNLTEGGKIEFRNQIHFFINVNTLHYYGKLDLANNLILNDDKKVLISWFKIINPNYKFKTEENTLKLKFHMMCILIPIIEKLDKFDNRYESNKKSSQLNEFFKSYNIIYTYEDSSYFFKLIYDNIINVENFPKEDIRDIIIVLKNF